MVKIKGFTGQRKIFNVVKYGVLHPEIIEMDIGKVDATHTAKTGGVIPIIFMSGFGVADYMLRDNATLSQLIGGLFMNVAKITTSTAASVAATSFAGTTTFAIIPLIAVIVVRFGISKILDLLDEKYQLTEKIMTALEKM